MRKIVIFFAILLLASQTAFAQRDTIRLESASDLVASEWISNTSRTFINLHMNFVYQTPEGFEEMQGERINFDSRQERLLFATFGATRSPLLRSIDGEMISSFAIVRENNVFGENIDNFMGGIINRFHHFLSFLQGLEYQNPVRQWLFQNYGHWQRQYWTYQPTEPNVFSRNWRDYAYFFPPEMVQREFNADMAALVTLTIPAGHYFQRKYRYIDIFVVQSNERGFVNFVSFYTDKAKQNIDCYRRRLMVSVHFKEECPPYIIWVADEREAVRRAEWEAIPIIHEWLGSSSRILTHEMRLKYQIPEGFNNIGEWTIFDDNTILFRTFRNFSNRLTSDDNEFVAFLQIFPPNMENNTQHQNQMNAIYNIFHQNVQVAQGLREWSRFFDFQHDWRESAYFFSPEETREKFNADTAAFFSLMLPHGYYYQGRFRFIDVFLLQKNGRGYVYFVSFYTETAIRNIDWYRRRLWGSLRYED